QAVASVAYHRKLLSRELKNFFSSIRPTLRPSSSKHQAVCAEGDLARVTGTVRRLARDTRRTPRISFALKANLSRPVPTTHSRGFPPDSAFSSGGSPRAAGRDTQRSSSPLTFTMPASTPPDRNGST